MTQAENTLGVILFPAEEEEEEELGVGEGKDADDPSDEGKLFDELEVGCYFTTNPWNRNF